jgi:serine/threonine protein kinase
LDVVIIPGILTDVEEICIVSELMDYDLHGLINPSELLDSGRLKFIMHQILCGVQVMHAAQTLHRDLKPKNILVNQDLTTKICDLGMGRGKMNNGSSLKMTMISRVATASYRAPDGILNISCAGETISPMNGVDSVNGDGQKVSNEVSNYTKAVDVWACGCIMAEMITGTPLFPYKDNAALLSAFVDLLGCPSSDMLERIPSSQALIQLKQIMKEKENHKPRLGDLFPQEDSNDALDLCFKLLNFDPLDRITISDALNHPFFDEYDEVETPNIDRFVDPTDDPLLDLNACNKLIIAAANNIPQSS